MTARKFTDVEEAIMDNTNKLAYATIEQRAKLLEVRKELYNQLDKERQ